MSEIIESVREDIPEIDTELAAIMSAVYGEEVRGSIHDAISKLHEHIMEHTWPLADEVGVANVAVESLAVKTYVDGSILPIIDRIIALEYKPITVGAFNVMPNKVEAGTTVSVLSVSWQLSKVPTSVSIALNGATIYSASPDSPNPTARTIAISDPANYVSGVNVTATVEFSAYHEDENGNHSSAIATATLTIQQKIYYGHAANPTINSAFLLGLTSAFMAKGATANYTYTGVGSTEYLWFALPSDYNTPTFTVGGFTGGFQKVATISHTNAAGYTCNYDVWRSDNAGLDNTVATIKV